MAKAKVTLVKGFVHDGRTYKIGDEFDGSEQEIELLTRQGYLKKPEEKDDEKADDAAGAGTHAGATRK
jgi:hypothetical protein